MRTVYLYTENFFWQSRLKNVIKKILGRNFGGPQTVFRNLVLGLECLGYEVKVNHPCPEGVIGVLSGPKTFAWAIEQKREKKIQKIVAGPNIALTPLDYNNVLQSSELDAYVVPSSWTLNWWQQLAPVMTSKLRIWPAGVVDTGVHRDPSGPLLVFQKNAPVELLRFVESILCGHNIAYRVVRYGEFSPAEFSAILNSSQAMVYLSQSESQGLVLHEAWMANAPTLVWNRGFAQVGNFQVHDEKISAPFLNDSCGQFFSSERDFEGALLTFLGRIKDFEPRAYSLTNFTLAIAAQKYLDIMQNL